MILDTMTSGASFTPTIRLHTWPPPPLVQECSSESVNSLERPPAAVVHQANSLDTDYGLTRPSNGRVPAVSDTVEQLERLPGGTTTQEINPPERAKVNARS
ncbi:Rcr1p [Saccharomyces cerevisiae VL3]|nr:Rcr1p [Saccharomyces cerevisiae Lalvin QA23]EGA88086.1 Rcr1p [Saccharomyces cerevisiae VL3]